MKVNVMLIDDDIIDLFISQKNIEKLEIDSEIKTFGTGISAINYLKKLETEKTKQDAFIPDYILLDINMPKMNGFQFMNEFNKLSIVKERNIKVYMLSASNNTKFIDNAKSGRFSDGFMEKPLTVGKLDNMLENFKPFLNENELKEAI